jgi:hypothetical protein
LVADTQLKLKMLRLGVGGAMGRYWVAARHTIALLGLVWRYAGVIQRFEEDARGGDMAGPITFGLKLLRAIKLRTLLRSFEMSYDEGRREARRLRRVYTQLKQAELRGTTNVNVLATPSAASFQAVAVRHEFRRLVRLHLSTNQVAVLSYYPTVGRALIDFLQYCGHGEVHWIEVPPGEAIEGFTKWAQLRHTRTGAQDALHHLYRSRRQFASWASAIQQLEARLDAARSQWSERRNFYRTQRQVRDRLRLDQLDAARTLDPLVQAMALHRSAQTVYFHALGLLASAMGRERPAESQTNSNKTSTAQAGALSFERAMVHALEGLNVHLKAVIAI